jgi:predicted NBD/HSP70 family sugar kinase
MPPGTPEVSPVETVGVDLGGTKMLVGAVDEEGRVLHRRVVPSRA